MSIGRKDEEMHTDYESAFTSFVEVLRIGTEYHSMHLPCARSAANNNIMIIARMECPGKKVSSQGKVMGISSDVHRSSQSASTSLIRFESAMIFSRVRPFAKLDR